ncbi:alpha/beta hydrolase [Streptococcus cuniculipharyngis]|uniref:Alpha/beta hydrolase n=1 Tax=Streptococcus cuniculipharyngis TaxID=1562651 RepID=A0A5C5S802_9STRE|nr:alpha/beta hydrolase [Streptococcus cuniculipharyngis]TWS96189.1 alpha/beta hydrolase [Streptococcus cuniculipharyngis]
MYFLDALLLLLSLGLYLFFNQLGLLVPLLITVLAYRCYKSEQKWQRYLTGLGIVGLLLASFLGRYSVTMLVAAYLGFLSLCLIWSRKSPEGPSSLGQKLLGLLTKLVLGLAVVLHLFFIYNVINPDFITSHTNVFFGSTVVPEKAESKEKGENGVVYYRDLTYPSQLGNNKLDIYTTPNAKGTIFYIHGGGYAAGDKIEREDYLFRYVTDGYNVVNVNYLLSPKARYKDGLRQVDEALAYVEANAATYGIDTNKIILSGDSAGGQLAGQLALVLTNPDYAQGIQFSPLAKLTPKGYIGVSSWSDIQMGMKTGVFAFDWLVAPLARSYFQVLDVVQDKRVEESSILKNVNQDFPASFISDGNTGSFTKSNQALVKRLEDLGVPVASQFYDVKQVKLPHIFELRLDNSYAQEVYAKQVQFLDNLLAQ